MRSLARVAVIAMLLAPIGAAAQNVQPPAAPAPGDAAPAPDSATASMQGMMLGMMERMHAMQETMQAMHQMMQSMHGQHAGGGMQGMHGSDPAAAMQGLQGAHAHGGAPAGQAGMGMSCMQDGPAAAGLPSATPAPPDPND